MYSLYLLNEEKPIFYFTRTVIMQMHNRPSRYYLRIWSYTWENSPWICLDNCWWDNFDFRALKLPHKFHHFHYYEGRICHQWQHDMALRLNKIYPGDPGHFLCQAPIKAGLTHICIFLRTFLFLISQPV